MIIASIYEPRIQPQRCEKTIKIYHKSLCSSEFLIFPAESFTKTSLSTICAGGNGKLFSVAQCLSPHKPP